MLQNTFLHLSGIGESTERRIWASGLHSWTDYLEALQAGAVRGSRLQAVRPEVEQSVQAYEGGLWRFFECKLPSHQKWRAFGDLADQALYVDIETTGMGPDASITVIGTYDGKETKAFIAGENMLDAVEEIERHPLIVTYNGASFDMPMIRSRLHCELLNHVHIDLRFPLHRLGYTGGLKSIEKRLKIERSGRTQGLDGWDAVRLWYEYRSGNQESLELLLEYNQEDIVNLEPLMQLVWREMSKGIDLK